MEPIPTTVAWFLKEADWALLLDNSRQLRVIGRKSSGTIVLDPAAPDAIRHIVRKLSSVRRRRINKSRK
jgi:hypothetical protein